MATKSSRVVLCLRTVDVDPLTAAEFIAHGFNYVEEFCADCGVSIQVHDGNIVIRAAYDGSMRNEEDLTKDDIKIADRSVDRVCISCAADRAEEQGRLGTAAKYRELNERMIAKRPS